MKSLIRKFATLTTLMCIAESACIAASIDLSETLFLERYTILGGGLLKLEQGYLMKTGQYKVILTSTERDWGQTSAFEPVNGKPIIPEELYEGYKALGVIPNWVRSRESYKLGVLDYVIVSVKGKGDPNPVPLILAQPKSLAVLLGNDATFSVDASPKQYLTYQWWFKNTRLSGENGWSLTINHVNSSQAGTYKVELNTGSKSVFSSPALLKIAYPVLIKSGPKSQAVKVGKAVAFRVAAQGTPPFTYQWYFNSVPISQANMSFYSISKVGPVDAGKYAVRVSNGVSWAESAAAVLTVNP